MFRFITSRPLWVNIIFAFALVMIILFLFLLSLGFLTDHGKTITIPTVTGKKMDDAIKFLEDEGFEVIIQDSVYVDTLKPLQVVKQLPEADELVKSNRTVYLTVNRAVPPMIEMPNLVGPSFRNAELILKQQGLKLGDTTYKPDWAKNSVLEQWYKGDQIKPGTKLLMGSTIDLVLGSGLSNIQLAVPDLFGKTYRQAKAILDSAHISIQHIPDADVTNVEEGFIYRQEPERFTPDRRINPIRPGQAITVFLSAQPKERIDSSAQTPDNIPQ